MTRTALFAHLRPRGDLSHELTVSLGNARSALIDSVTDKLVDTRSLRVRGGCLPLFRADGDRLTQVVRLHLEAGADLGTLTFTLTGPDGATIAETTTQVTAGAGSVDLHVPEVTSPQPATLRIGGAGAPLTADLELTPQRKWTVYLVHHSHLDIGYTDPQGMVLRHHLEFLDSLAGLAAATDDWPEATRFRWSVEALHPLARWLDSRPPAAVEALLERVRAGQVEVTAMPFSLHTEAASTLELHHLLRSAVGLRERHGIPLRAAMQTDVPGAVAGLVDALADADVRYLSVAHNWAGRSVPYLVGGHELGRPFWWRSRSGKQVLVWYTDTPHGIAYMEGNVVGLGDGYDLAARVLPAYLAALASHAYPLGRDVFGWSGLPDALATTRPPYPHDILHLRVQAHLADNAPPTVLPAGVARHWNEQWAYPRLRTATNTEFFEHAEQHLAGRIPTHTGDWNDWWADGMGSGARPLGYNRRAQAYLASAQTLHALAGARGGDPGAGLRARLDATYDKAALFDEHTWGAANPWEDAEERMNSGDLQWTRKREYAQQAHDDAQDLLQAGARRLAATFTPPRSARASVLAVNPSGQARTDVVRVFLPTASVDPDTRVSVVDARTGAAVAHHETAQDNLVHRPAGRWLEFLARDVPALGFVRYDLAAGDGPAPVADLTAERLLDGVIENDTYRVTYDRASAVIGSVFDKTAGRELVNPDAAAGFNQYVYDSYTSGARFNHLSSRISAVDQSLLGSRTAGHHATITSVRRTAVGEELAVDLLGDGARWIRTVLRLPAGVARLDITNRLAKEGTTDKESAFFAFPFAAAGPPAYEVTGGVASADGEFVPGSARHMRAVRHWAACQEGELAMAWATMEAPLVQLGNLHLPYAPFPPSLELEQPEPATIWSWIHNNIWDTNFPPTQQGEMTFRYAVGSAAGTPVGQLGAATAEALTTPLVGVVATGAATAAGGETPPSGSALAVEPADVRLISAAPGTDGGLVVRLQSLAAEPVTARLRLGDLAATAASAGTLLERGLRPLPVQGGTVEVELAPGGTTAVVLQAAEGGERS